LLIAFAVVFDGTAGEWTEVPSRKKVKGKREGSELTQEQKTTNEPADQLQQVLVTHASFSRSFYNTILVKIQYNTCTYYVHTVNH